MNTAKYFTKWYFIDYLFKYKIERNFIDFAKLLIVFIFTRENMLYFPLYENRKNQNKLELQSTFSIHYLL